MNRMNDTDRDEVARIIDQIEADARSGASVELDAALDAIAETVLPDTITRYFEAHVTLSPVSLVQTFEGFRRYCGEKGWKASTFEHDDVDGIAGMWFMSARHESYSVLARMTREILDDAFGRIERYKIEETLLDSKLGDTL